MKFHPSLDHFFIILSFLAAIVREARKGADVSFLKKLESSLNAAFQQDITIGIAMYDDSAEACHHRLLKRNICVFW